MLGLNSYSILFIVSVSFQLSGALVLLINTLSKKGLESDSKGETINILDSNGFVKIGHTKTDSEIDIIKKRVITRNRFAFVYLIIGYLLSIFSSNDGTHWITLVLSIILTIVICGITIAISGSI